MCNAIIKANKETRNISKKEFPENDLLTGFAGFNRKRSKCNNQKEDLLCSVY